MYLYCWPDRSPCEMALGNTSHAYCLVESEKRTDSFDTSILTFRTTDEIGAELMNAVVMISPPQTAGEIAAGRSALCIPSTAKYATAPNSGRAVGDVAFLRNEEEKLRRREAAITAQVGAP